MSLSDRLFPRVHHFPVLAAGLLLSQHHCPAACPVEGESLVSVLSVKTSMHPKALVLEILVAYSILTLFSLLFFYFSYLNPNSA